MKYYDNPLLNTNSDFNYKTLDYYITRYFELFLLMKLTRLQEGFLPGHGKNMRENG